MSQELFSENYGKPTKELKLSSSSTPECASVKTRVVHRSRTGPDRLGLKTENTFKGGAWTGLIHGQTGPSNPGQSDYGPSPKWAGAYGLGLGLSCQIGPFFNFYFLAQIQKGEEARLKFGEAKNKFKKAQKHNLTSKH